MKRRTLGAIACVPWLAAVSAVGCSDRSSKPGTLTAMADEYGTDKGTRGHHYTGVYELFFQPIRYQARKIFEIGVLKGASLRLWRDYFPNAQVYGIDIEDTSSVNSDRIKTFIADQADRKQLQAFLDKAGGEFDIILDDGGHSMEQQQVSFGYLFPSVKPGGYYIIEDVHTSLYAVYQGDYGALATGENTTLTMIDNFIRTGAIESRYMTQQEEEYASANAVYANLVSLQKGRAIACVFQKRDPNQEGRRRRAREKT